MNYYNQTYLSYFKVHEQKLKVFNALTTEHLEVIKSENEQLLKDCDLALERLDIQDAFFGDEALWNAANNIILQIKKEALEATTLFQRKTEHKMM